MIAYIKTHLKTDDLIVF